MLQHVWAGSSQHLPGARGGMTEFCDERGGAWEPVDVGTDKAGGLGSQMCIGYSAVKQFRFVKSLYMCSYCPLLCLPAERTGKITHTRPILLDLQPLNKVIICCSLLELPLFCLQVERRSWQLALNCDNQTATNITDRSKHEAFPPCIRHICDASDILLTTYTLNRPCSKLKCQIWCAHLQTHCWITTAQSLQECCSKCATAS